MEGYHNYCEWIPWYSGWLSVLSNVSLWTHGLIVHVQASLSFWSEIVRKMRNLKKIKKRRKKERGEEGERASPDSSTLFTVLMHSLHMVSLFRTDHSSKELFKETFFWICYTD